MTSTATPRARRNVGKGGLTMRRIALIVLAAMMIAAPFAAFAQTFSVPGSPTILWNSSSQTIVNTNAEVNLFQYTVPAALIATTSAVPSGTIVPTYTSNATTTGNNAGYAPQPLHFRALGLMYGGQASLLNIGISLQGTTATLNLNNIAGPTLGLSPAPARLDVYVVPVATSSATPTSGNVTMLITARFEVGGNGATATQTTSSAIVSMNTASASTLNVAARWTATSSTAALTFLNRILRIGE